MSGWKKLLLDQLISALMTMLSPALLKDLMDKVLDFIEEKVEDSDTEIDDKVVIPLVNMIRESFNIPDGDD